MPSLTRKNRLHVQRAALCALALFVFDVACAQAAPNPQQIAAYEAAPEMERVRLLMHLAKSGLHEDAAAMLHQFPLTGAHAANRTLYVQGLILKAQGDLTGAAAKFRAALADDPSLTLVRADLAEVLVTLEEDDSAKHQLELLAADAPDETAASGIRSFIETVDSRRPYTASGYVSVAPSTNLNNGSKRKTVYFNNGELGTIDKSTRANSGLGIASGVNAAYSKRLGNDFSFIAAGSADAQVYTDKKFNTYSLSQSVEVRNLLQRGYLGLGAVASQSLENDKIGVSSVSYGPRVSASLQLTAKDKVAGSATFEWRDSLERGGTDSTVLTTNASWTHGFNSTLSTTVFGGFTDFNSDSKISSYATKSAGLSVYKELSYGITAKLTGQVMDTDFDIFNPFIGVKRKDTRLVGSVDITKRDWNILGFAPSLSYTFSENFSNHNLYDYNSHAMDFRLTKEF